MRLLPVVLFLLYGAYYYFSHQEEVPLTGRKQIVDLTREQEARLGFQSYQQLLRQERVVPSGEIVDQVRRIGAKISAIAVATANDPKLAQFKWEYNVIESDQANAFCLPGGKVAVYTGILPVAKNVSGLAAIMGHEIAHAIARHGAERMAQQKLAQFGTLAAGVAISDMDVGQQRAIMGALGVGTQFGILLPFSRDHESEADYLGLIYLAKACYDPTEAPRLWERMGALNKGGPAEFMSTHPSSQTRIRQFQKWMPQALQVREESNCPASGQ